MIQMGYFRGAVWVDSSSMWRTVRLETCSFGAEAQCMLDKRDFDPLAPVTNMILDRRGEQSHLVDTIDKKRTV